ncbi:hypothetical protein J2X19_000394 [Rhodoferax ferrireducens]|uniref:DUF4062 domain-containing protein n=1 Tax=Rhodoferax ferrireducens TaxID=192843 RepID=A0ABU2C322_9BURK|nr:DUF4062 domain-containing protein [Rhodoferax ferrireducens]MDR7375736.1 hypothetical protein [Rhodoferax ferrireducens]
MHPLSLFISSTCYDLKSLREHLRSELKSWGHDPVLSEFPSFPVSPELSTVENCKRVVRERADLLVLIIGGKRGSLDPNTKKSVVNSEYQEARLNGLDCVVFVDKQVWDLLPIYRKNKEVDFAPTVDNPAVFAFIEQIIEDTKWVFPFNRTEEILETLRVQLSTRFRDLLLRSRQNRLSVPPAFAAEPGHITRIAVDKPELWEYRLACALLKDRSRRIDERFGELESGFVVRRTKFLPGPDTLNYIQDLLDDLVNIVQAVSKVLAEQLTPSFGPPGVPGNAENMKAACDNLYLLFLTLFEWELDVRFVRPHEACADLFPKMHGWTTEMRAKLKRLIDEFETLLSTSDLSGNHTITMTINAPAGLQSLVEEFHRMAKDPKVLAAFAPGA